MIFTVLIIHRRSLAWKIDFSTYFQGIKIFTTTTYKLLGDFLMDNYNVKEFIEIVYYLEWHVKQRRSLKLHLTRAIISNLG